MFRLIAEFAEDHFAYTLSGDGEELFSSTDSIDLAEMMLRVGIDNPLHLIEAAQQWGVVEIRETAREPLE